MSRFLEKFFSALNGEFNSLKLSTVNLYVKKREAEFTFVCPENDYERAIDSIDALKKAVNESYKTDLEVSVKVVKSHFDDYFFTLNVIKFFDSFASLKNCVSKRDIIISHENDKNHAKIELKPSVFAVFEGRKLINKLRDFVNSNYCEPIEIEVICSNIVEEFLEEERVQYVYDSLDGRTIDVIPVSAIVGNMIHDKPIYICDAIESKDRGEKIVLCGKVSDLREFKRKNAPIIEGSEGETAKKTYNFYKFFIDDTTARVACMFFANEKTAEAILSLKEGDDVIVGGKLEDNVFNGTTTLNLYVSRITLTEFPKNFRINRLKCVVPNDYKLIFPSPYVEFHQESLFVKPEPIAEYLLGKSFCVFDIETTGLSQISDRIIEIGAVKIVNGVIVETFSTLIDPQMRISEGATRTHGLTDVDVKDAYLISEILPDFLKFSDGTIIVGYNSELFDFPILSRQAKEHNIYFDNERLDLMVLCKKYLKLHNYKLDTAAKHFGIMNEQAHRAVADALTTAKVFIKLANFID